MTGILTADNLATLSGIHHAFFERGWGNGGFSGQINSEDVYLNRKPMAAYLNVAPSHLLTCYQIHSATVVCVDKPWESDGRPEADALVTNKRGLAIGVVTADCVPVLFADKEAGVIGAAHAGWRGALEGVLDNTIAAMETLGAHRKMIVAALGPCIWQKSYEVGPEFLEPFLAENAEQRRFFRSSLRGNHYQYDLPGYVVAKLEILGLSSINPSQADTCAEPSRFFSHRYSTLHAEKRAGNMMAAIALGHV